MVGSSKNNTENYPRKCFWTQEKETWVKFNPGLSANRPSNNWALFYSLLTIVLAATSSASSEDTPSTHRYKAKSAEFPPKCFRITMNLFCCSVAVVASRCRHVSSHLLVYACLFFLRCLVEMLVNGGQEMDSARDCKYKFSINLVMRKPEYR